MTYSFSRIKFRSKLAQYFVQHRVQLLPFCRIVMAGWAMAKNKSSWNSCWLKLTTSKCMTYNCKAGHSELVYTSHPNCRGGTNHTIDCPSTTPLSLGKALFPLQKKNGDSNITQNVKNKQR